MSTILSKITIMNTPFEILAMKKKPKLRIVLRALSLS